jgi:hypothetical protein
MVKKSGPIPPPGYVMTPSSDEMVAQANPFDIDHCEYYFLIDRSGSMEGATIKLAVEALKLFLYSLPVGSKFNIVSFGPDFEPLYKASVDYNDQTLHDAVDKVSKFDADMGGTELMGALQYIYSVKQTQNYTRQIFLLTDGAVNDTSKVVKLIRDRFHSSIRFNTFGIGSGVSTDLVKNSAKAGAGMYYFIDKVNDIEKYVIEALCLTLIPYISIKDIQFFDEKQSLIHEL